MSDRLHIIIAADEGKIRTILLSKWRLQMFFLAAVSVFIALSIISYNALHFFYSNKSLNNQVTELSKQLEENLLIKESLALQVQDLQNLNNNQVKIFQQEKDVLLNTAVTELEERSSLIERIICNIGIDIKDIPRTSNNNNSGGPFLAPKDNIDQELLFRSDYYMETMHFLPLGRPVPGDVTSRFGHRTDPVNGKKGFHSGVDLGGRYGQKILATADGIVTKSLINGGYGHYVEISHGNGYTTKFAHMKKRLVKRGEKVKRGQAIGTMGSSGRSTGPHLHYEICLNKKPLNPARFMRVDKLVLPSIIKLRATKNLKIKHKQVAMNTSSTPAALEN